MIMSMGEIINTKASGDKVVYKIALSEEEAKQLRNNVFNVHLFSDDLNDNFTRIIERGNKGGAKYFVIPLSLKTRKKKKYSQVIYQKIEDGDEIFYICTVKKDPLFL